MVLEVWSLTLNRSARSFLKFAHHSLNGRLQPISAPRVGKLLKDHKIDRAVLTACKTAKIGDGVDANLAESFTLCGVSNVLGMSFEFLSSATAQFAETFYRSLCADSKTFAEASSEARRNLRDNALREAKFGTTIPVVDWFVPVTYASAVGLRSFPHPVTTVPSRAQTSSPATLINPRPDLKPLVGRQFDVLRLESQMTTNTIVALSGRSGTGKTYLLRHLAYVWEITKFADRVLYVDAKFAFNNGHRLLSMIFARIFFLFGIYPSSSENDDPENPILSGRLELFEKLVLNELTSTILILDNLDDALRFVEGCDPDDMHNSIQPALEKLFDIAARAPNTLNSRKGLTVIVSSRWVASRWHNTFKSRVLFFPLPGLRLAPALTLAQKVLAHQGREAPSLTAERIGALEDIVNLLDRLPGPILIVLRQFQDVDTSPSQFYKDLLCGRFERRIELVSEDERFALGGSTFLSTLTPMLEPGLISDIFGIPNSLVLSILYSLSVFWNEGPEWNRYTDLLIQTRIFEGIELEPRTQEKDFMEKSGSIMWHLKDLDALDYEGSRITWIHPLLTLSLRNMAQNADPAYHRRLQDIVAPSIWKGFFAELLHEMLQRWETKASGSITFAALAEQSKQGRQNLALCLEACLYTPLQANEWPLQYFSIWVCLYRYAMTSREQSGFLASLSEAVGKVVKFVDSSDSPQLRNWHLIWTVLFWIYEIVRPNISWDGNQRQNEIATRYVSIAQQVIARSKEYCANLEPVKRAIARIYRLKALILLSHFQIDDAQNAWVEQNDMEDQLYGISKDDDFYHLEPGQLNAKPWSQALLHLRRFLWHRLVSMLNEPEKDAKDVPREFFSRLVDTTPNDWEDMLPVVERMGYLPPDMSSQTTVNSFFSGHESNLETLLKTLETYLRDGNIEKALFMYDTLLKLAYENRDWGQIFKLTELILGSLPNIPPAAEKRHNLHSIAAISSWHLGNYRLANIYFAKAVHVDPNDAVIAEAENFLNGDPLTLLKTGLAQIPPTGRFRFSIAIALYLWLRCDAESSPRAAGLLSPYLCASADTIVELFTDILRRCFMISSSSFLDLHIAHTARMFDEIECIVFCRTQGTWRMNPLEGRWIFFEDSIWPLYFAWLANHEEESLRFTHDLPTTVDF